MLPLADLQRRFAGEILMDGTLPFTITGRLQAREALRIHRNTVLGALTGALRISYPTVDALVGEVFFDQAAALFAQSEPPRTASLSGYGRGFADFLAAFPPCAGLPYLADVARLDFAIEQAANAPSGDRTLSLDAGLATTFPQSLTALKLNYPADEIRAAIGDDAALATITPDARERYAIVWRDERDVHMRRIQNPSGRFLQSLLAGAPPAQALAGADDDLNRAFTAIQSDLFTAPFRPETP